MPNEPIHGSIEQPMKAHVIDDDELDAMVALAAAEAKDKEDEEDDDADRVEG